MEYFHTDWAAMTLNDWLGMTYTLLAFAAMVLVYVVVFRPGNKAMFDAKSDMILRDSDEHNELGGK